MKKIEISINPFAEFLEATESRRIKILEEQQDPDPVRIPYYQLARARMKKSIELSGSFKPVNEGINLLKEKKPEKKWQKNDVINSVIVLEKFKEMPLNKLIRENELEILKPEQKHIDFHGITIKVSPNIIFRVTIDEIKYIGACKIHVSKEKAFSHKQSKVVASLLELYLSNCVAEEDEIVDPVLCFCLDPFAGTTINSNSKVAFDMKLVKEMCKEIKRLYDLKVDREDVA
jgi:hypothetical protein